MPGIVLRKAVFLTVILLQLAACGGGNGVQPLASVKTSAPAAPDPALIPTNTVITLTYNASMDPASLVLGGDMAGESGAGVWSTTNAMNDTLTLSPASSWAQRTGRHLVVDAKDTSGRQARTVNLEYDIYRGLLYYVNIFTGNDGNTGMSVLNAFKTLSYAAANVSPTATILVATGTYTVSLNTATAVDTRIWLRPDISLYGGYSSDFTNRNPKSYQTLIKDQTSTVAGSAANPNFAFIASDGTITDTTLVDGFYIYGNRNEIPITIAQYTAGIRVHNGAAPAIANNFIYGGRGATQSIGVFAVDSAPAIYNNTINGGSGYFTNSTYATGIDISGNGVAPEIVNNLIYGGTLTATSTGYRLSNGTGVLRNNIVSGGNGTSSSTAVSLIASNLVMTNPNIDNNILFTHTGSGGSTTCIHESTSGGNATPASLRNNDLFNCAVFYYDYEGGCTGNGDLDNISQTCTLSEMNALTDIAGGVSGNISVDPQFANITGPDTFIYNMEDNDWHYSVSSPASVTAGGLNGIDESWSFITDKDNAVRPASGMPWSIGAYQPTP